jgi:hypothetical protein
MRISIFSLFLALAVAVAGPPAFAETDVIEEQVTEQEQVPGPEALTEAQDTVIEETQTVAQEKVVEMKEAMVEAEDAKEDCANGADDDGDEKVDCDDSDCAGDPACKSGY